MQDELVEYYENLLYFYHHPNDIFLKESIIDTNIDDFYSTFTLKLHENLLANKDYQVIYQNKSTTNGYEDRYIFNIKNLTYYTNVYYYHKEYIIKNIQKDIEYNMYIDDKHRDILNNLIVLLKNSNKEYIMAIRFEDDELEYKLTNKAKNLAYTILSGVYTTIKASGDFQHRIDNVASLYYVVSKKENKRIKLYQKIIESTYKRYNKFIIDDFTNDLMTKIYAIGV